MSARTNVRSIASIFVLMMIIASLSATVLLTTKATFAQSSEGDEQPADSQDEMGDFGQLFGSEISGKYEDADAGYSITFPDGWSGVSFLGNFPVVAPGGFLAGSQNATIMVIALNRTAFEEIAANDTFFMTGNLTERPEGCGNGESYFTTVNGMSAFRAVEECDIPESGYTKSEIIAVVAPSNIIMLAYSAHSPKADQLYYKDFTEAKSTFKVKDTEDFRSILNDLSNTKPESLPVQVDGNTMDVTVTTSSKISNLSVSKEEKRISFTVEGESGTRGMTIVAVQDVLQGPYNVTVDGNTTAFMVIKDEKTGEILIEIMYPHSKHDVVITGTQVIPEFPLPVVGMAVASIIALIIAITRTRLIGCFVQDSN